jgi:hypothetical protein
MEVHTYYEVLAGRRHQYHPPDRFSVQPWWTPTVAFAAIVIGAAIILWLLPERRRLVRRFVAHFGSPP